MEQGFKKGVTDIRTKRLTNISWVTIIIALHLTAQINAVHIDFDDAETSWLKNIAVRLLPVSGGQKQIMLKLTGLVTADIEDGVRIKPTFSDSNCAGNESDLPIINDAPWKNNINRTSDFIVSLADFDSKQNKVAYLCIKTKLDYIFQHMGPKSEFQK